MRLDGDYYESTMDGLNNLYDKVSVDGFAIIDDYGRTPRRIAVRRSTSFARVKVLGCDEVRQVRFELLMRVIEEAFDGGFRFIGSTCPFAQGRRGWNQTVADAITKTDAIEGMSTSSCRKPSKVLQQIGELDLRCR
jgi:hypothetical protein